MMAYEKQNFVAGDVLPASQLNDMDNQIAQNEISIISAKTNLQNQIDSIIDGTSLDYMTNSDIQNLFS